MSKPGILLSAQANTKVNIGIWEESLNTFITAKNNKFVIKRFHVTKRPFQRVVNPFC